MSRRILYNIQICALDSTADMPYNKRTVKFFSIVFFAESAFLQRIISQLNVICRPGEIGRTYGRQSDFGGSIGRHGGSC